MRGDGKNVTISIGIDMEILHRNIAQGSVVEYLQYAAWIVVKIFRVYTMSIVTVADVMEMEDVVHRIVQQIMAISLSFIQFLLFWWHYFFYRSLPNSVCCRSVLTINGELIYRNNDYIINGKLITQ